MSKRDGRGRMDVPVGQEKHRDTIYVIIYLGLILHPMLPNALFLDVADAGA